jgi:hypothetical protein
VLDRWPVAGVGEFVLIDVQIRQATEKVVYLDHRLPGLPAAHARVMKVLKAEYGKWREGIEEREGRVLSCSRLGVATSLAFRLDGIVGS